MALLVQLAAVLLTLSLAVPLVEHLGPSLSPLAVAIAAGALAAAIGWAVGLSLWWMAINLLFWPTVVMAYSLSIQPVWFLAAFSLLLAVYWSVFRTRVPLYLTGSQALHTLAHLLPKDRAFRFVDLGAGTGRVLRHLAKLRPGGDYRGIESAPLPFLLARLGAALSGADWRVRWGSFWRADLGDYDVIYAYLSPAPMKDLLRKLRAEMKPGALFISNTFPLPGATSSETVELPDIHRSTLYLYRHDDIIGAERDGAA